MQKALRILKKILIWFGVVFVLFVALGLSLTFIYADKVESLVMKELNKQLNRPVQIEKMEFSFFKKFPKASVEINHVQVEGVSKQDELFISSEKIYLSFDLFSLFKEDIVINEIDIENATVNVEIDKKGNGNYSIFKTSEDTSSSNFLAIEKINLLNTKLNYLDQKNDFYLKAHSFNSSITFSMGNKTSIVSDWNGDILSLNTGGQYFPKLALKGQIEVEIENGKTTYSLKEGVLYDQQINVAGNYDANSSTGLTKIDIPSGKLDHLLQLLPSDIAKDLRAFKIEGNTTIGVLVRQNASGSIQVDSEFKISGASVQLNSDLSLNSMNLKGTFKWKDISKPAAALLDLKQFNFSIGGNEIAGYGQIVSINNPQLNISLKGNLDLAYLFSKLNGISVEVTEGKLDFNTTIVGNLKNAFGEGGIGILKHLKSTGDITVSDLSFKPTGLKDPFKKVNGKINFNHEKIQLIGFSGEVNESVFDLDGHILNYVESWAGDAPLEIMAQIKADELRLESFIDDAENQGDGDYYFSLPEKLKLDFNFSLGRFSFKEFVAEHVEGKANLDRQILRLSDVKFRSCEGSAKVDGRIVATFPDKVVFEAQLKLQQINIKKAFEQLDNFGQEFLLAKHVKGEITTDIYLLAETNKALQIDMEKLYVESDIKIVKGELNQFEPLIELEKYLKEEFNIVLPLADLKFNTLENSIQIANRRIKIPEMKISSSAIDLDVSGYHTFDQEIYYLFKIKANEIFKAKKRNEIDEKYGVIENKDNTSTLPLLMKGTVDNPEFSYDMATKKEIVKENLKDEGQDVKKAFNKEIKEILGKQDSTIDRQKEKDKNTKIQVIWDEE